MKNIKIAYFAKLREEANKRNESLETEANTGLEIFNILKDKYNFSLCETDLKIAINEEFADWNTELKNNDVIVFIQPVAGG